LVGSAEHSATSIGAFFRAVPSWVVGCRAKTNQPLASAISSIFFNPCGDRREQSVRFRRQTRYGVFLAPLGSKRQPAAKLEKNQDPKPTMKWRVLPRLANGTATVITMIAVAFLLVGWSDHGDHSKPNQRESTSSAGKTNQTIPDWAVEKCDAKAAVESPEPTDAGVFGTDKTNAAAPNKTNLTPQQISELKAKAEKGDAEAQFRFGMACYRGDGVPEDAPEGIKWMTRAAETGHALAAYELARGYRTDFGVATMLSLPCVG
jgi:hypothetical protein